MQVDFYQLGDRPAAPILTRLAERVLDGGGRFLIVHADPDHRAALSKALWNQGPDSFPAHAEAGGEHDARQPILLSADPAAPNTASAIALADGHWRDEALTFDRAFHLFDDEAVDAARAAWRGLAGREGVDRRFWRQEDGRWVQAA